MARLYNIYGKEELKKRLMAETFERTTVSFYRYVIINEPNELRDELFLKFSELHVFGRIYLAKEGINAQISVPEYNWEKFTNLLYSYEYFKNIPFKIAVEDDGKSFYKLKIKVRPKIVADGLNDGEFDVTNVGNHLTAEEFNQHLDDPNTIVVDMRNHYESEIGHFKNAICPDADTFREELPIVIDELKDKKDKKILMYCTGGIRCEKASAYLKHHGFQDVNQLHGGIIEYARQIKAKNIENKFVGKNFVFDERLGERISCEVIAHCHQCGEPCDTHTNCANDDCHLLFIQCDSCKEKYQGCCSTPCQEIVNLPVEEQKKLRKGKVKHNAHAVFKKGRVRPKLQEMYQNAETVAAQE